MKVRYRILIIVVISVLIVIAVRARSFTNVSLRTETAETRLQLESLADQDISAIQEEIDLRHSIVEAENSVSSGTGSGAVISRSKNADRFGEEIPSLEELQNFDFRDVYRNSVIMGDSILQGLAGSDILSSDEYVIHSGVSVDGTASLIYDVAEQNPDVLFVAFGLDDMDRYGGDVSAFRDAYDEFLSYAQDLLPYTDIYAMQILPIQSFAVEDDAAYYYLSDYNTAIGECCAQRGITCMNLDDLFPDEYYASDGIHPLVYFYYGWLYYMAKGARLL